MGNGTLSVTTTSDRFTIGLQHRYRTITLQPDGSGSIERGLTSGGKQSPRSNYGWNGADVSPRLSQAAEELRSTYAGHQANDATRAAKLAIAGDRVEYESLIGTKLHGLPTPGKWAGRLSSSADVAATGAAMLAVPALAFGALWLGNKLDEHDASSKGK